MNSATGGRGPVVVDGCGPMLKPFISRLSFCLFFFPPVPKYNEKMFSEMSLGNLS